MISSYEYFPWMEIWFSGREKTTWVAMTLVSTKNLYVAPKNIGIFVISYDPGRK